jgi:hypothetical protein
MPIRRRQPHTPLALESPQSPNIYSPTPAQPPLTLQSHHLLLSANRLSTPSPRSVCRNRLPSLLDLHGEA